MNIKLPPLNLTYGSYDNMKGYWCEIKDDNEEYVISGGYFEKKEDVFKFYLQSKKYFGDRLKGKVEVK